MKSREGSLSPEPDRQIHPAKILIREWLSTGDLWLQPDPEYRDEPHLRWRESELSKDLEAAAAEGRFSDEDKIRLREAFGEETTAHVAYDPEVAERIKRVIESL